MCVTDFYTCCSFCGKTHGDGFLRPLFLATDFFVAREHASHVHLGAFVSQNHSGTDHWVRLAVQADASCQTSDTCNTIDNHNAGVSPLASLTTSWRCNLQPRVCHLCCNANLVPDWGKTYGMKSESRSVPMAKSIVAAVADVLNKPTNDMPVRCSFNVAGTQAMTEKNP